MCVWGGGLCVQTLASIWTEFFIPEVEKHSWNTKRVLVIFYFLFFRANYLTCKRAKSVEVEMLRADANGGKGNPSFSGVMAWWCVHAIVRVNGRARVHFFPTVSVQNRAALTISLPLPFRSPKYTTIVPWDRPFSHGMLHGGEIQMIHRICPNLPPSSTKKQ